MPTARNYTIGQTVGKRTILADLGRVEGKRRWQVRCECGHEFSCLTQGIYQNKAIGCRFCAHKADRPSRRKRPYEWRYNATQNRARHPMVLTYDEFFEFTKITECHYCGESIEWGEPFGKKRPSGLNLDRKDSKLSYTKDNVVVSCRRCNYGKNNFFSYDEWKQLGDVIRTWRRN